MQNDYCRCYALQALLMRRLAERARERTLPDRERRCRPPSSARELSESSDLLGTELAADLDSTSEAWLR